MIAKLTNLAPMFFAGAAAAAIAVAPLASAAPAPPPCTNPDGTPCASIANIDANPNGGADVNIPNGPQGTADNSSAQGAIPNGPSGSADNTGAIGSLGPNGPSGSADNSGASGCWPNVGCINIPAP